MRILAIDTSTLTTSVAAVAAEQSAPQGPLGQTVRVLAQREHSVSNHSGVLIELVDDVLRQSQLTLDELDGYAIGAGPGSFTGLRIGMATAKGLAFATGKPLWAISSLAALAWDATLTTAAAADNNANDNDGETLLVPVLDARRSEIFAGLYRRRDNHLQALAEERVMAPEMLADTVRAIMDEHGCSRALTLGDAITVYRDRMDPLFAGLAQTIPDAPMTPSAISVGHLAALGNHADITRDGTPTYIRPSEAEIRFPNGNTGGTFAAPAPNNLTDLK